MDYRFQKLFKSGLSRSGESTLLSICVEAFISVGAVPRVLTNKLGISVEFPVDVYHPPKIHPSFD